MSTIYLKREKVSNYFGCKFKLSLRSCILYSHHFNTFTLFHTIYYDKSPRIGELRSFLFSLVINQDEENERSTMITPLFLTSIVLYLGNFVFSLLLNEKRKRKSQRTNQSCDHKKAAASIAVSLWGGNLLDSCITDQSWLTVGQMSGRENIFRRNVEWQWCSCCYCAMHTTTRKKAIRFRKLFHQITPRSANFVFFPGWKKLLCWIALTLQLPNRWSKVYS